MLDARKPRRFIDSLFALVEQPALRLLDVKKVNRLYEESLERFDGGDFPVVLETLGIDYRVSDDDLAQIPAEGPVVVVANHPYGALDGVILGHLLRRRRQDVRLVGNRPLEAVRRLEPWVIPLEPGGGEGALRANVRGLRKAVSWLQEGGVLGVFPAGEVSHLVVRDRAVTDPAWHRHLGALVRRTGATVVPVFIEGRNSALFQLAGLLHPNLRAALLPRELLRKTRSTVDVRIGHPIGADKVARWSSDETLTEYLRWKTYMLRERESPVRRRFQPKPPMRELDQVIASPVPREALERDVAALPAEALLAEQGDFQVFIAQAPAIPNVLNEIGRLREVTFRAVGEGTGRASDLDRFDAWYHHLFMWNKKAGEVVGSYRLGRVDDILATEGISGLYTHTLFKFRPGLLQALGPSLELGRSFVRAEYQRKPTSLALVWRGIGAYLVRNPRYKVLWGPVSISQEYSELARGLMVELLTHHRGDDRLSSLVRPRNPPKRERRRELVAARSLVESEDDLNNLVAEVEGGTGMPILLRHYLKLNARLLGFNVDPAFGSCLDGLIVVDLRTTPVKTLKRFMGEDGFLTFTHAA